MILKTLIIDEIGNTQKWWLVDNIQKVSYREAGRKEISDYVSLITMSTFDMSNPPQKGCLLVSFLQDGIEQYYALNDITYLLNDEGKTIERIW